MAEICEYHNSCYISFQLVKVAKKLKKEKVMVDVVNFGEEVTIDYFQFPMFIISQNFVFIAVFSY